MLTVSLCMIVKNEEKTISRCLETVKDLVDEIVIVDTGSTDKTKEIVYQFTDRVIDFHWINDFAAARNFAFSQAKMDYILWLDADDLLLEEDRAKFLTLKSSLDPSIDSVTMHYYLAFDDNGNVTASLRRNRLVKRQNNFQWNGAVHEYLEVWGNILHSDVAVTHNRVHQESDRNLRIYETRLLQGEQFSPRDLFYFANELFEHQKNERAIEFYKQFLNTRKGWVEDNISACGKLADCYIALRDKENEYRYILKSFEYDSPRAEFCCRLGNLALEENQYQRAIFWYNLATQLGKPSDNMGMINHAYWTWLPHLQLCVCYDRLGNHDLAYVHNEMARQYDPNHPSILYNKQYLEPLIKKTASVVNRYKDNLKKAGQVDNNFQPINGTNKLKITYVLNHVELCGGVKILLEHTNHLVKRGHTVNIVCYNPMPSWFEVHGNYIQVKPGQSLAEEIPNTDIIITTVWDQMEECYQAQKAPIIHFEQGDIYIFEFDHFDQNTQEMWKQRWSVPIPILAVSSGLAGKLERNFNRKAQVIHNALNKKVFYKREKSQDREVSRILFVGPAQYPFKGISEILQALKIVKEQGYEFEPVWVTPINPETEFDGEVHVSPAQDKLGELYRTSDIYVCGSYYESFGLPPLEAMTCGCSVVSTRNVGILEYAKDEENCLLTDIGDPNGLAKAIIELIVNKEKRALLVENGYKTAEKFNWENIIERLEMFMHGQIQNWLEQKEDVS